MPSIEGYLPSEITASYAQFEDGSVSSPSVSFIKDTNTGFYRFQDNTIGVSTNGNQLMLLDSTGVLCNQPVGLPNGSVSYPSLNWQLDTSSGFYRIGNDNFGFSVNGVKLLDISSNTIALLAASGSTASFQLSNLNSTANSKAVSKISVGGASADDAYSLYQVDNISSYAVGIDNSDSDRFKISYAAANDAVLGTNDQFTILPNTNIRAWYPFQLPLGLVSNPALQFAGDTNLGLYRPAAATLAVVCAGAEQMTINTTSATFTNFIKSAQVKMLRSGVSSQSITNGTNTKIQFAQQDISVGSGITALGSPVDTFQNTSGSEQYWLVSYTVGTVNGVAGRLESWIEWSATSGGLGNVFYAHSVGALNLLTLNLTGTHIIRVPDQYYISVGVWHNKGSSQTVSDAFNVYARLQIYVLP